MAIAKKHDYTYDLSSENFDLKISPSTNYGYFEHNKMGDNCGGGLWFTGLTLDDYDGVAILPKEVAKSLRKAGYFLDETFD